MKTWFNLWPIFLIPLLVLVGIGFLPSLEMINRPAYGGPAIRVFFVDHGLLPLLSNRQAWAFAHWYQNAVSLQHVLLHVLISLNVYVLSLPVMWVFGSTFLSLHNWSVKTEFEMKRGAAKK